jgi:uncharacterized membrane protein HdeD (DUF308 family)
MLTQLSRNWWVVVLRGIIAILYGIIAFVWPGLTLEVLVLFFGAYAFVDGIFAIVAAFTNRTGHQRWWLLLLEGLVGIAAGVITFLNPGLAMFMLLYIISFWAILTGVLEIFAAIRLREEIDGEWKLALGGILSIVFGILLQFFPVAGSLVIIWMIGLYSILFGLLLVTLGLNLRQHHPSIHHQGMAPTHP